MWSENSPIKSAGFKLGAEFGPQGYCDVAISQQRPPCARFHNRRAQPWLPKSKGAAMGAVQEPWALFFLLITPVITLYGSERYILVSSMNCRPELGQGHDVV